MNNEIKDILEEYPQYQETLFRRGYLITSSKIKNFSLHPFMVIGLKRHLEALLMGGLLISTIIICKIFINMKNQV